MIDICNRCGRCCTWQLEGMREPETCKYLIRINDHKTHCRIYNNQGRLGLKIGVWQGIPVRCVQRKDDKIVQHGKRQIRIIPGCPYNPE